MSIRGCLVGYSKTKAAHFNVGQDKRIVLPLDQAGWHTSEKLEVPEGIHLVPLPPYSPELQPAERLWPLVNEPLANQAFETQGRGRGVGLSALSQVAPTAAVDSRINILPLVASS